MNLIKETIYTNKLARRFAVYKINKLIMAYKQKPGRGKSNPFKAMEKYTSSPLMNGDDDAAEALKKHAKEELTKTKVTPSKPKGMEIGTVLKKDNKSYEIKSIGDKETVVSTGTGITRIPNELAKSMYVKTLEYASKRSTRSDLATSTSNPKRDEAIEADMKKSSIVNYEQRKHLFKKD